MSEERQTVEFIESYIKIGNGDYHWNDNHGELIRCKDCRFRDDPQSVISEWLPCQFTKTPDNWYCACGRRD